MAISFGTPNKLHANGISNSDPPGTPDAPAAETAATTESSYDEYRRLLN